MSGIVELHLHDYYSALDGYASPEEYMERAKQLGMTHLAQTNHGTLGGNRHFHRAALAAGITPILGVEAYISETDRFDRRSKAKRQDGTSVFNHITLLSTGDVGLRNLNRLSEIAWTEGFYNKPRCLLPGQEIVTKRGYCLIEDISVGDEVLDKDGKFSRVTSVMKNNYSGPVYGIDLATRYGRTTWMTPEHPVLIRKRDGTLYWEEAKDIESGRRNKTENVNNWNSWVCFPILSGGKQRVIQLENWAGWEFIGDDTWKKHSPRKKDIGTNHYCTLPRSIVVDEDFARFIGLFVAEGWTTKRGEIGFAFHRDEEEYADFVCQYIESLTGRLPRQIVYDDRKSRDCLISHRLLAHYLELWCGKYAHNKALPDFIVESDKNVLEAAWRAVIDGDGCWQKKSPHASLGQTSRRLAWQMKTIAATVNGDFCSVRNYGFSQGFPNGRDLYSLNFSLNPSFRHNLRDENYVYRPIKQIHVKEYKGYVYNLEVEGSHTYTTDFVTHNCDVESLIDNSDGLVVLSGCLGGIMARAIEAGKPEEAMQFAEKMKDALGDNFYIEVQGHNPPETNYELLRIADFLSIQPVATSDCHYSNPEDLWVEEALLILSTNPAKIQKVEFDKMETMSILEKFNYLYPDRKMTFQDIEVYLRGLDDHQVLFHAQGIDRTDIYENTLKIAASVGEYEMPTGLNLLPQPKVNVVDRLTSLCRAGMKRRGLAGKEEYEQRLAHELDIIHSKDFSSYFLIVSDMITWAKRQDILVGPGRGSAAGSLVCYVLGITDIDPIEYNLLFGRFINVGGARYSPVFTLLDEG